MSALTISYCGEQHRVSPTDEFSFGRSGDLAIDENRFLHRVMAVCFFRRGWWWLVNVGAHLPLHLQGIGGTSTITLSPGGSIPLVMGMTTVRFAAGGTSYELEIEADVELEVTHGKAVVPGDTTIDAGSTPLTADQLLLLVALSEPRLRQGPKAELPTNVELMERFGWSVTKFNRKLDNVCLKFSRRGVGGLVGSSERMAQGRRSVLVDYLISSGMVTNEQLSLLPPRPGRTPPRR